MFTSSNNQGWDLNIMATEKPMQAGKIQLVNQHKNLKIYLYVVKISRGKNIQKNTLCFTCVC